MDGKSIVIVMVVSLANNMVHARQLAPVSRGGTNLHLPCTALECPRRSLQAANWLLGWQDADTGLPRRLSNTADHLQRCQPRGLPLALRNTLRSRRLTKWPKLANTGRCRSAVSWPCWAHDSRIVQQIWTRRKQESATADTDTDTHRRLEAETKLQVPGKRLHMLTVGTRR